MMARPIMVQGTMSGVGKSLVAAGLCRVFAQDGLRVAPFKSQNMALNSFICADGAEIGRAQAMQAEAAGIAPEAAMNPILLKPTTDVGSQVIVNGTPIGTMPAREYFAYKHNLVPHILEAYHSLAARFDVIVIEGAGSPAEVNLKDGDIVNMGMAKMAKSPVLLVGDIDRGGVFAQLIGTMDLLEPDERALVKALVVNKFRGDAGILQPGISILRERTGVPVAGVLPYTPLQIDEEDSLAPALGRKAATAAVDIAVVRLPRISNFTDFTVLDVMEEAAVRYVSAPRELGEPDLVIIPGTKSTIADLRWLRESGLEAAVLKRAAAGTVVMGICGGFQMLGAEVSDPLGVEGGGAVRGLGLLPYRSEFSDQKVTRQVQANLGPVEGALAALSGVPVRGYEIHMGRTEGAEGAGLLAGSGNVYGTYVHGIFDTPECSRALVGALLERKGMDAAQVEGVDMAAFKQGQYDKLAQVMRDNLDMGLIYRIVEEGA